MPPVDNDMPVNVAEIQEELRRMRAENEALKAKQPKPRKPTLRVSQKGAISIYGLQRFPVTLYASTWKTVFGMQAEILKFIEDNTASLAKKGEVPVAQEPTAASSNEEQAA
jgi:hypothetical protein